MNRPIEILLVEDNPGDRRLTIEALKEGKITNNLSCVEDGEEALQFLKRQGKFKNSPRPDLILLDLNLPKVDGREVLSRIKADPELRRTPTIILTTSRADQDVVKAYDNHANCFISKPVDLDQFLNVVRTIEDFWLTVVSFPPNGHVDVAG